MDLADLTGYSLRRELGSGPAGTVWQVRDRASGRNAVLKHVPHSAYPDRGRLREDLSLLSRFRHPHVAQLHEYRETDTGWILITQHLAAGSLAALLTRRGPLSRGELVTLLAPLAEALAYLHASNLAHGSIRPENVLFDADGRPILTDAALRRADPATDHQALATLADSVSADPKVFPPTFITKAPLGALPHRLLTHTPATPIDLAPLTSTAPTAPTSTPPPHPPPPPPLHAPAPPTAHPATPTPSAPPHPPSSAGGSADDDDAPAASRTPLAPPPADPPATPLTKPQRPHPTAPSAKARSKRIRPNRRNKPRRTRFVAALALPRLPHPAYGVLAAAAVAAIIVLAIAIATLRTIDTPATAQPDPSAAQSTARQPSVSPPTQSPIAHPTAAHPTAAHTTASSAELATWIHTLEALDAQRAQAFWTLDLDALDRIYVPGSAPWRTDRALLSAYRNQNVRVQGLRITIESTAVTRRTATTVTLKTTDHLTAGQAVDHTGAKTPLPPGPPTTRLITLTTTPRTAAPSRSATRQPTHTWRITTITQL
ncbi:serine/threonine protein kinase [Kribbella sp. VKM Ac-2571]|uniref:protein kinase domain-containing protein n=1 Tax=Kribbella sp. VKM Ac-2571 TaxID=2512222 RepID=UPI00105E82F5|nr:protein kinase [Kribbella sp. VKM Ac-2571]TDO69627.1 serine/threonine protein kinase [Kribbella sp. VKM Ac-2571]